MFLFILFVTSCSGLELGARPSEINIDATTGKSECSVIHIFSSSKIDGVFASDSWTSGKSKDINYFNQESRNFYIDTSYDKYFALENQKNFNFCVIAQKEGDYKGVILFEAENSNIILGVWINLVVHEEKSTKDSLEKISGLSFNPNFNQNSIFLELTLSIMLIVILIFMLLRVRRERIYDLT